MSLAASNVWASPKARLEELLRSGYAIDEERLVGDYRGVSLGLPAIVERLTWKVFVKVFRRDAQGLVGHNVRLEQRGVEGPCVPRRKRDGSMVTFGPYRVKPLPAGGSPFRCREGLLLDYGARHPIWHPLARVRDPIVAVNEGSVDLLLGATFLEVGGRRIKTPSFFTLQRIGPSG